jgi:hypothetical protein
MDSITDNVGTTGYNVYQGTNLKHRYNTTASIILTAATAYTFSISKRCSR